LQRFQKDHPVPAKGLTKAGIREMIARWHEELAVYEGGREVKQPETSSLFIFNVARLEELRCPS
jgi:hypothetical protein